MSCWCARDLTEGDEVEITFMGGRISIWWIFGIGALASIFATAGLLGPLARRLAAPYLERIADPKDQLESLSLVRQTLGQAVQNLVIVGGVIVTVATLVTNAHSLSLTQKTLDATRDGQVTDRYARAVEQLGSADLNVRIGGIWALDRVGMDSQNDEMTVAQVLSAFIRDHNAPVDQMQDDVSSALKALQELSPPGVIDLSGGQMPGVRESDLRRLKDPRTGEPMKYEKSKQTDLSWLVLDNANLAHSELEHVVPPASFRGTNLTGALLTDMSSHVAPDGVRTEFSFVGANLAGATVFISGSDIFDFSGDDLASAILHGGCVNSGSGCVTAEVDAADFSHTRLVNADLAGMALSSASFSGALMQGTDLRGSDVSSADITVEQVLAAKINKDTHLPDAVARDPRVVAHLGSA